MPHSASWHVASRDGRGRAKRLAVVLVLLSPWLAARSEAQARCDAPQEGRALQIEDFYRLSTLGAPSLSPDGRWVAYVRTTIAEATNRESTTVWVVGAGGRVSPRRVSPDGENASRPQWMPDGRLSFVVRGERWAVDASGGAATKAGVNEPSGNEREQRVPSPDGTAVVTLRPVSPPPRAPLPLTDFERRHEERFKGVQFDWLDFQRDGQPFPVPNETDPAVTPALELWLSAGGSERQLTRLGLRPEAVSWSADGSAITFVADTGYRNERKYGSRAVYVARLDGTVRNVTPEPDFDRSAPRLAPDGKWVLYTRQLSSDVVIARAMNHGGPTDLVVRAADGGAERVLTAEWDLLPSNASWSPDGRWIYFMGGVGGAVHLFRVAAAGGPVEQVTSGERRILNLGFDRAYSRIVYAVGAIESPAELFVANVDGSGERRLTSEHDAFRREIALSCAERLRFASADGTPVEGWLLMPRGYRNDGQRHPLVVSNHGGPHAADGYQFDFKSQYLAANGYFVLKVNFRSSTGYGEKFLWATWGAWGTKDGEDVMAGIDHVIARHPIDRTRVATIGHSYGGFMTNWLITQYPDRFAAAIPGAGIVNWVSDYGTADVARTKETEFFGTPWDAKAREIMVRQSPLTYADRVKAPTLFVHGEVDQRVPYSEAEQMYVALKKNGVPARMIMYEGMAHGIIGGWNQVHRMLNERRWLDQWLKGVPTS